MNFPASGRVSQLALAALLLGMPCLAIATLVNPVAQAGGIDAYVYTGLLHDYTQVLRRYGATYYANRVAFTVPARMAIALLGDAGGHFLFQTLYLFAATLSGFALGRRYFSAPLGVAAAAWVAFNPWLIRALAWDYPEGAAVSAMLVAFCCFSLNWHRPILLHVVGGVSFALAFNAYLFVVAMAVAFAPAWLILNLPRGIRHCLACATAALAAFVLGYAGLILVQYAELPELGFGRELVTLGVSMRLLGGVGAVWYRSVWDVLAEGRAYIFMPVFLTAGLAILIAAERVAGRRPDPFPLAATIYLGLTCAAYLLFHDYFHTAFLTTFWFDGYAFPAGLFVVIALLGRCILALPARTARLLCGGAALCFALLWFGFAVWHALLGLMTVGALAVLGGGLAILMAGGRFPALRAAGALGSAILAIAVFYFPPDPPRASAIAPSDLSLLFKSNQYAVLHDPWRRVPEREIYQAALFLQRAIAETLPVAEGPVGFWYGHEPEDQPFESVQSVFLFEYSRIVSLALPHEPNSHLDAELRRRLARYAHVAILSRTQAGADAALQALGADGAVARTRARFAFPGPWFGFVTTIVDYEPPPAPVGQRVARIPTNILAAQTNASVAAAGEGIEVHTAPQQWAYSAIAPLTSSGRLPPEKLVLRLRLRVLRGEVGVIVSPEDLSAPLITELGVGPTAWPHDVDLAIPDGAAAQLLIIRNWAPSGPSIVQVSDIAVFRAPP